MAIVVNGERIEDSALLDEQRLLAQTLANRRQDIDTFEMREWISSTARQNVISHVLLVQRASQEARPLTDEAIEAEVRKRRGSTHSHICGPGERHAIEQQIRVDRLLSKVTRAVHMPRRREVERYYNLNRSRFIGPESARVRHIVKNVDEFTPEDKALEAISKAREELRQGVDFAKVADRYSDCAGNGGALNWIIPGEMVEEFDAIVFALKTAEISNMFQTRFGFHIAQVLERRPAGIKPLEEIRESLSAHIFEMNRQRAIAAYTETLTAQADIHIVQDSSRVLR